MNYSVINIFTYFADADDCQKGRQIFNGVTEFILLHRPSWLGNINALNGWKYENKRYSKR